MPKTDNKTKKKTEQKKAAAKKGTQAKKPKKAAVKKASGPATKVSMTKKTTAKKPSAAPKKASKASFSKEMSERLVEEKRRILQGVSEKIKKESNAHKFEIGDIYDIASNERDRELTLMLGDRDRNKLGEIEDALERLKEGEYEVCEECGEPIEQGRLRVMPFTRLCVECQTRNEREQRIKGRVEEEGGLGAMVDRSETEEDEY